MQQARTVDDYLAELPPDQAEALADLRRQILALVPAATEKVSYGIVTFSLHGQLVGIGAAKKHCGLYVMDSDFLTSIAAELTDVSWSVSTIRFRPNNPLPPSLVERIVLARAAANQERATS